MAAKDTKLLSLHKLAFYKKKKHWKLPEDVRKVPPSEKLTNSKQKETHADAEEPESEVAVEEATPHDRAFKGETAPSDDEVDPQPTEDEPPWLPPVEHMSQPEIRSGDIMEDLWEDCRQSWCGVEAEDVHGTLACDQHDGAGHKPGLQHSLWTSYPASQLELNSVHPVDRPLDYLTPEQMWQTAGDWLTLHNYPVKQAECVGTCEEFGLENESAEFVRGSHYAPHSTEIDLSITQECEIATNNLYELPERQLAEAIQKHHSALTLLLKEQALREGVRFRCPFHPLLPSEDADCVLAGSHRLASATDYDADTGSGLGRLQQRKLIGINMGRPYWL